MANDFSKNPLRIDTVMSSTYQNSSPPNNLSIYPRKIYWEIPVNVGDTFLIQYTDGTTAWAGRCETSNQSQLFDVPKGTRWIDFKVSTLSSGTLYIYFTS